MRLITSIGYGFLGAYQGAIFGFSLGMIGMTIGAYINPSYGQENDALALGICAASAILGGAALGYLGSRADAKWEKGCLIGGAVIATGVVAFFYLLHRGLGSLGA